MQGLHIWRILLVVVGGVALVALSLGLLAAAPAQAAGVPNRVDLVDRAVNQPGQPPPEQITSQCWPLCFTDPYVIVVIVPQQQVDTNIGSMQVWGGGNNAQVRIHMQHVEDNVQYQFNFKPEGIIYDEDNNPIGVELSGRGEQSEYGPFDVTAAVRSRGPSVVHFILNGEPFPSIGLKFEAKGSLTFEEEPDPPQ
jgi:hypothetical protein